MYAVSSKFHEAVAEGNDQKALLIFKDTVFTGEDINIDRGITFHDRFSLKDSLCFGQTLSNEISFSLFNDNRYLNNYEFGDFLATIGVKLGETEFTVSGNVFLRTFHDYVGNSVSPYLTRGGSPVAAQPSFAVTSLLGYDGLIYAFSEYGDYAVYEDSTGANVTSLHPVNTFMRGKVKGWVGKGYYYYNRNLFIYDTETGKREQFEFCPLGHFTAERPNASDKIVIDMSCFDLMQRFDDDMPSASKLGISYPTTIGTLFVKLCDYVELPYRTRTFINSGATISEEPEDFARSTMRTVLGWIAEAAGSNARIDRDGYVVLDWVRAQNSVQTYNEGQYVDYEPYWYETKTVGRLYVRDTTDYGQQTVGSGKEGYLIQDNPLLNG